MNQVEISVVATIYNSAESIETLVIELEKNLAPLKKPYEIILVNDNSCDKAEQIIEKLCKKKENLKCICLSRNFGQQIAMNTGIAYANGNYIVIMDGDLQNPPEAIPSLYKKIAEGYDIVYTTSKIRNNFFDETTSRLFWFLITKVFNIDIVANQLMLKIFTRQIADRFNKYNEHKRVVADLIRDTSSNYAVIEVQNNRRLHGKSSYNFFKRSLLMLDFIFNITAAPLNWLLIFGFFTFIASMLFSVYKIYTYIFYSVPVGYTSIVLTIIWFNSIIIMGLGFIGKYIANIYTEIKRRPLYFVAKEFNL